MGDSYLFDDVEFSETSFVGEVSPDDLFSMLEALEGSPESALNPPWTPLEENHVFGNNHHDTANTRLISQKSTSSTDRATLDYSETELEATLHSPTSKRQKLSSGEAADQQSDGQNRMVHIRVERNRRKQMNEHLSVLRTLMPCFYVKRGDQASIVGGVVDYIKELQQVLHSLEAKKQRKVYSEVVLSPRVVSSPRPSPLSPRKPPLSPRVVAVSMPISPRTPQPTSPYKPRMHVNNGFHSQTISTSYHDPPPSSLETLTELAANSKSSLAEVEVKYSGSNLLLRTVSPRIPGQAFKIITALENHSLEILHVSISTVDDATILNSFTIKIGIECKLSADELAHEIQQTFC